MTQDKTPELKALDDIVTQIHQHIELRLEYGYVVSATDEINAAIKAVQDLRVAAEAQEQKGDSVSFDQLGDALEYAQMEWHQKGQKEHIANYVAGYLLREYNITPKTSAIKGE